MNIRLRDIDSVYSARGGHSNRRYFSGMFASVDDFVVAGSHYCLWCGRWSQWGRPWLRWLSTAQNAAHAARYSLQELLNDAHSFA